MRSKQLILQKISRVAVCFPTGERPLLKRREIFKSKVFSANREWKDDLYHEVESKQFVNAFFEREEILTVVLPKSKAKADLFFPNE